MKTAFHTFCQVWDKATHRIWDLSTDWSALLGPGAVILFQRWTGLNVMPPPTTNLDIFYTALEYIGIAALSLFLGRLVWAPFAIIAEKDEKIRALENELNPPSPIRVHYDPSNKSGHFIKEITFWNAKENCKDGEVYYLASISNVGNKTINSVEAVLEWGGRED